MKKLLASLGIGSTLVLGGVDASVLEETPINKTESIAGYEVKAEQKGNVVETTLPWKDQNGLKVKYDMGEPTLAEKVKDKRKEQVITETVTDFDGGFKVDIILDEKPDTNVFCYAIEGAENYDFFYQAPLTPEEIEEGASRPPEIEGSYAVYHKTLANHIEGQTNYETGKVMHIPRPQVWSLSDESTKEWADLSYDERGLCVTAPQDFLDKAVYPVRVDPTFGYTTAGASLGSWGANYALGSFFNKTVGSSGTVNSISFSGGMGGSAKNVKGFVTDSSLAILTNGITPALSITSDTKQWWTLTYSTSPSVTSGSDYGVWIVIQTSSLSVYRDNVGTSGDTNWESDNNYTTPTSPSSPTVQSTKNSIYATYTESGGGGSSTTPNQDIIFFD